MQNVSDQSCTHPLSLYAQKIDQAFVENSMKLLETNREQVTSNKILMVLLTYYLLSIGDHCRLLNLLNKTRSPEL